MASQLACCGIKFGWFDELVAHCQEAHTVQATQAGSPASEHESTQQSDSEDLDVELYEDYDGSDFEKYTQRAKRGAPVKKGKHAPVTRGEFLCHIKGCSRSFSTLTGVNSHISHMHPNATRDFKCTAKYPKPCKEAFYSKYSLENHRKRAHQNTYVCKCSDWGFEDCEASFRALSDIKNHLETEHDQFVCRSTKHTSCKFAAESQAALIDHYEFVHKELAPAREASVAPSDLSRFNVDRHGGFQNLAGRAGIQTKSQDRRTKGTAVGLRGTPRFPKGYQHHELSEGVVGRRREDDIDRYSVYRIGYISGVHNKDANVRGNQTPLNGGSGQGLKKTTLSGQYSNTSRNAGHLRDALKNVLDGDRGHMNGQQYQSQDTEFSDNDDDSDGFDEALSRQFMTVGKAGPGCKMPRTLGSRAYANANLFKHTQIQPTRRPGHGSDFGSPAQSTGSTPKPRKNNIYTRSDEIDFMNKSNQGETSPHSVSDGEAEADDNKPIKKRAVQRLTITLTNAEEDMLRYTGYFPHRQRFAKPDDISVAERERYELGKWTAHRTFEVRMEFHSNTDINSRLLPVYAKGSVCTPETPIKSSDTPNKTSGTRRPYQWQTGGKWSEQAGVNDQRDNESTSVKKRVTKKTPSKKTPTKRGKKTAATGTPKRSWGGKLGNTKPLEERKTMLNKRKKNVVSEERVVESDAEDGEMSGADGEARGEGFDNYERTTENGEASTATRETGLTSGELGNDEIEDLLALFD